MNYIKINNKIITDTYINLDYIKQEQRLKGVFSNDVLLTNIKDKEMFLNDLVEYEKEHNTGVRKDRTINYGVILTFMINNKNTLDLKVKELAKEIINNYVLQDNKENKGVIADLPYYAFIKRYKKSLYLKIYVCEREYYEQPKHFIVRALKDTYKNNKGVFCKANSKGAKIVHLKGDILREYNAKFSTKKQFFKYPTEDLFIYKISKLRNYFIELCKRILEEIINETISFKRYGLKKLDFYEKHIARVWTRTFNKMEQEFSKILSEYKFRNSLEALTFKEENKKNKKIEKELYNIYKNFNDVFINNYRYYEDNSKQKQYIHLKHSSKSKTAHKIARVSINFKDSLNNAKDSALSVLEMFKEELKQVQI